MIEDKSILAYSGLTYYDERIKDYIDNTVGGSALHPGSHILIDSANTISAVYDSSDFDISGLTDSQNLRETWNNKQDTLSAGTGIIIDANNVISVNEDEIAKIDDTVTETNKTWSSNKLSSELATKQNTLTAGTNIDITNDTISAKGYIFNGDTNGGFAEKYKQDSGDGGQIVNNTATGLGSHAEGYGTSATGDYGSHAEGCYTIASYDCAHAEGFKTQATGDSSHAEGQRTKATNYYAHAEGNKTNATGFGCHAEGFKTTAQNEYEHAEGTSNYSHTVSGSSYGNAGNTQHSVGIGGGFNTEADTRKNAFEIMQNGDMYVYGVGGYIGTDTKTQDPSIKTVQDVITGKQDKLIPGPGVEIDSSNTITVITSSVTEIDDTITSSTKTWSSEKISGELEEISYTVASHIVEIEDDISGLTEELAGKSNTGHTHEQYSLTGHTHEQYSLSSHTHSEYSLTSHTHTAEEVGALPDTTSIPSKTSDLTNDSGFITGYTLSIASSNALGGVKINGNNLSISNDGTLSATDTKYSASDFDIKDLSDTTGLRNTWSGKQDVIDDLDTIRSGATLGATALQSVPSEYITDTELGTTLLDYYTTGDTYTKTEVNNLINNSEKFHYEIYANLSDVTDPKDNVLYLIGPSGTGSDKYEEYVYANNVFTKIGDTTIDLTGYATITTLTNGLAAKSDTGHTHSQYSLTSHTHTEYSLTSHTHTADEIGALPSSTTIPTTTSQLTNDSGFITGFTETDPTVPAWAKESTKPTYSVSEISGLSDELSGKSNTDHTHDQYSLTSHTHTAQDIGALPSSTTIPSATSQLTNDSGFITGYTETDPTVPAWAKAENKPTYDVSEISGLQDTLNGKSNTGHTHSEYSLTGHTHEQYSLTSHTHTAAEVGALPDTTSIPNKTSDLTNDSGFITGFTETDPTVPAWAKESTKPTYSVSEISGLSEILSGKSDTSHTHEQYSLTSHTHNEYSLTSHTHTAAEVGALPDTTNIPSKTSDLTNDSGFITGYTETDPTVPEWAKAENKPTYGVSEISGLTEELATKVESSTVTTIWSGTQQEYDDLQSYDNNTLYIIK